jgi:hypothetical protein
LGIANPPTDGAIPDRQGYFYDLDKVDAWKAWWNEVKAGKRTYRFIGSSVEYGPDGPIEKDKVRQTGLKSKAGDQVEQPADGKTPKAPQSPH